LAKFLDAGWLELLGLFVAAVAAAARVVVAVLQARVKGKEAKSQRTRRTRVPIQGLAGVVPTQVGVDTAAAQSILPGKDVPEYLPREADSELDAAVQEALDGSGSWIVVAVGSSKVGKSRAVFEALKRFGDNSNLSFVAPVDVEALKSLLAPGELSALSEDGSILWLDDLEPFINQGLTLQMLQEWHDRVGKCIVVATYGGKGSEIVGDSGSDALATVASEVLQRAHEVPLEVTSAKELDPLRSRAAADVVDLIERYGLAAVLVAGPELQRKLTTHRHSTGQPECPEGVAVIYAAIDWARCGRTDAISDATLRKLWSNYLPNNVRPTDDGFDAGLVWALKSVAGPIALLEHVDGYRAYDYIVRFVASQPNAQSPRGEAWASAVEGATDAQAITVGVGAYLWDQYGYAEEAFRVASVSSTAAIAAMAQVNLGAALGELDRHEEEIAAYEDVAERFGEDREPA
jgi:hypothetical protein